MKTIIINYDEENNIGIDFDKSDYLKTLNIMNTVFNGILHKACGDDKELLYLNILEITNSLRTPVEINFSEEKTEEEEEIQTIEATEVV